MSDMAPEESGFTEMSNAAEAAALAGEAAPEAPVSDAAEAGTPEALLRNVDLFEDAWDRPGDADETAEPVEPKPPLPSEQEELDAAGLDIDYQQLEQFLAGRPDLREAYFSEPATSPADFARMATLAEALRQLSEWSEQAVGDAIVWASDAYQSGEHDPQELAEWLKANYGLAAAAEFAREWHAEEQGEHGDEDEYDEPLTAAEWAAREFSQHEAQQQAAWAYAQDMANRERAEQEAAVRADVESTVDAFAKAVPNIDQLSPLMHEILARAGPGAFAGPDSAQTLAALHRSAAEFQRVEAAARQEAEAHVALIKPDPWAPAVSDSELERQTEARIQARMADTIMERVDFGRLVEPPSRTEFAAQQQDALLAEQRRLATFDDAAVQLADAYERGVGNLTPAQLARREARTRDFDYERSVVAAGLGGQTSAERTAAFTKASGGTPAAAKRALPDGTQTIREWEDSWGS